MPDWNRILVGDRADWVPRNINYYRDIFLLFPVCGLSLAAIFNIFTPESPAYRVYGFKAAACAIVALLLANERLALLLAVNLWIALRTAIVLAVTLNWRMLVMPLIISLGVVFVILRNREDWRAGYRSFPKMNILSVCAAVAGVGAAGLILSWLKP